MSRRPKLTGAGSGTANNPILMDENGQIVATFGECCCVFTGSFSMLYPDSKASPPKRSSSSQCRNHSSSCHSFAHPHIGRILQIYGGDNPRHAHSASTVSRSGSGTTIRAARHAANLRTGLASAASTSTAARVPRQRQVSRPPLVGMTSDAPSSARTRVRPWAIVIQRRMGWRRERETPLSEDELYVGTAQPPTPTSSPLHEYGICFQIQSHPVQYVCANFPFLNLYLQLTDLLGMTAAMGTVMFVFANGSNGVGRALPAAQG
jgi:hypothetical protein